MLFYVQRSYNLVSRRFTSLTFSLKAARQLTILNCWMTYYFNCWSSIYYQSLWRTRGCYNSFLLACCPLYSSYFGRLFLLTFTTVTLCIIIIPSKKASFLEILCLKRTWLISGMQHHDGRSGGNNVIDQQTQTPGDGVSVAFRTQLKNATRNIKNRWSSSGADAAAGMAGMMSGSTEESQSLLSGAGDLPHETPTHRQHQQDMVNRNLHHPDIAPPPYPPSSTDSPPTMPSTSQLQCAINLTLKSSHESNTLSTTAPDPLLNSGHDVLETICWKTHFIVYWLEKL